MRWKTPNWCILLNLKEKPWYHVLILNMISGNSQINKKKKGWHFFSWKSLEKSFHFSDDIIVYFHVAICRFIVRSECWNFFYMQFALSLNVWLFGAENFKSFCVSAHFDESNIAWVNNCKCTWAGKLQRFNKCWFWNLGCNHKAFSFSFLICKMNNWGSLCSRKFQEN